MSVNHTTSAIDPKITFLLLIKTPIVATSVPVQARQCVSADIARNRVLEPLHRIDCKYSEWPRFTIIKLAFIQKLFRLQPIRASRYQFRHATRWGHGIPNTLHKGPRGKRRPNGRLRGRTWRSCMIVYTALRYFFLQQTDVLQHFHHLVLNIALIVLKEFLNRLPDIIGLRF